MTVGIWKSDNPFSITQGFWKLLGQFVKMRSILEGFSGSLKYADLLIILLTL